ncbi:retropepsin-like domain-containing protein [Mesobacillus maritimus]|uniref:retropepsin-like aspartic protease n=1 Tax=Mesobacillus maritimus TaxID=1643336 RepID=UPI00204039E9|nr:retropepsin-like domain-containing protein [Mesobacillus maritimus]MCM3671377.1 retropepsin-like domain-containing protein [Mesobacillus maritimus]
MNSLGPLETFQFELIENTDENKKFRSVLKYITAGKDLQAIDLLKDLYLLNQESSFGTSIANLLFDLSFSQAHWKQMAHIGLLEDERVEISNRLLAKACLNAKPVKLTFSKNHMKLPMELSLSGCPTVKIVINGKQKSFWLDTGAGMSVISCSIAKECQIPIFREQEMVVGNSTNKKIATDLAFINTLDMGHLRIHNLPSLVIADDSLTFQFPHSNEVMVIDGIIGWDVLQHLYLEIDYKQREVVIQMPIPADNKANNLFFCGAPIVKVKSEERDPLYFGLDTGANQTHFGHPLLSKIKDPVIEKKTLYAGGLGDLKERELETLEYLSLQVNPNQNIEFHNLRIMLSNFCTFFKLDGVIGSDIARNGRLIIDYFNRSFAVIL